MSQDSAPPMFTIIELDDSSSDEEMPPNTTNNNLDSTSQSVSLATSVATASNPTTENEADDDDDAGDDNNDSSLSKSSHRILTRRQFVEQLPVASRTKRADQKTAASMRLVSLDFVNGKQQGLSSRSLEKIARLESTKKKNSLKDEIHEVVTADMKDPELSRLLKKIAYCRVFTNYLFRQYDMLTIDFKLYSDLDDLMLDLKRRVGAYNAIRRSRMQILLGSAGNSAGSGSNSSREGSTV